MFTDTVWWSPFPAKKSQSSRNDSILHLHSRTSAGNTTRKSWFELVIDDRDCKVEEPTEKPRPEFIRLLDLVRDQPFYIAINRWCNRKCKHDTRYFRLHNELEAGLRKLKLKRFLLPILLIVYSLEDTALRCSKTLFPKINKTLMRLRRIRPLALGGIQ